MTALGHVSLTLPASREYARTARLTAAELATRVGMDIDDVDDVKLAVEEAFVYAAQCAEGHDVTLAFELAPSSIELVVGPFPGMCENESRKDAGRLFAHFILESICDEFDISDRDGQCLLRLVKRAECAG
jgi:serine/threonine-protein kinase RsbW